MTYDEKIESISEVALADAFRCGYGREQEETVQEAIKEDLMYLRNRYYETDFEEILKYYEFGIQFCRDELSRK